jgi:hypothetical protein
MWNQILEQAKQDLVSSQTLFDNHDYGNSAYLLQQGMEKHIKAFILKYDLFVRNPQKFGHLPIIKMWEVIILELERKQPSFKKDIKEFSEKIMVILKNILKYFIKIKEDSRWKEFVWKSSLELTLNTSEQDLIKNFSTEMKKDFLPIISEAHNLFSSARDRLISVISGDPNQKILLENLVEKVMNTTLEFEMNQRHTMNGDMDDIIDKSPMWFEQLENLIKEIMLMSNRKNAIVSSYFMKVLLFAWLFSFREEIIMTFPHEEIGRYPNMISNSRQIYKDNKLNLEKFIQKVSQSCEKIDQMMDLEKN